MVSAPDQVEQIVNELVRTLEPDIRVERVILYGSYAHNRANEWSDIDVAVLSDDFQWMTEIERVQFLAGKTIRCDSRIVPIAYTPAQFDNAQPHQFAAEIRRSGRIIYHAPESAPR
jgi:hypothetical protein